MGERYKNRYVIVQSVSRCNRKGRFVLKELQQLVDTFVQQNQLKISLNDRLLDLVSEVGELSKEVLANSAYGCQTFQPGKNWAGEMGDVFFSLICLANSSGVDLEKALHHAIEKYRARLSATRQVGSGR